MGADAEVSAFGSGFAAEWRIGSANTKGVSGGFHKTDYDNVRYEGYNKNGKCDGKGTYTWSDGEKYTGRWKDGNMYGKGVLIIIRKLHAQTRQTKKCEERKRKALTSK